MNEVQQVPPQKTNMSLADYATGVDQLNRELQRQSAAYGHFRTVLQHIDALAADPNYKLPEQLPFVIVRFPQQGPSPGEMKIDLNALPVATVISFRPVFELMTQSAGEGMLGAWENLQRVANETSRIVAAARQASG